MKERTDLVEWIRSEIVGPSRSAHPEVIHFADRTFADPTALRRGPLAWLPEGARQPQEVLYYDRESPHRKYGAGLLHPEWAQSARPSSSDSANQTADTVGVDEDTAETEADPKEVEPQGSGADDLTTDASDDFEVTSPDVRHPTTIGISFCARLSGASQLIVHVPRERRFYWQDPESPPLQLNGRYESCERQWINQEGHDLVGSAWRRVPAMLPDAAVILDATDFRSRSVIRKDLPMPAQSPIRLSIEVFPRRLKNYEDAWIITIVMRNSTPPGQGRERESVLYQSFFEVSLKEGEILPYPESERPLDQLDSDEQSLTLLYRDAATWAIGHGCAGGWEGEGAAAPLCIFADIMPVVELPSMTPNIDVEGRPISLSMAELSELPDQPRGGAWASLQSLADAYADWIRRQRNQISSLRPQLATVATRHLDACDDCLIRIRRGIDLLKADAHVRAAFRLANLAMLLQQIATKRIPKRALTWDAGAQLVLPKGERVCPWSKLGSGSEGLGSWRAFQAAFLLMSLDDSHSPSAVERETVDLIWFPTGGGKTEAYLALAAFYMFHERLIPPLGDLRRDGTNVLMRYTLRMLTTQQFQRAASLICAMEYLRRRSTTPKIEGGRFSLGLWIGQQGSPNKIESASQALAEYRRGSSDDNPLVLTDCPWCRAEIGRYAGPKPQAIRNKADWNARATCGLADHKTEGPRLHCSDPKCEFGGEQPAGWLPIEVIDERIYLHPPSLVIATVDKLAMVAYRPRAGALFGRSLTGPTPRQTSVPPGLIIQDELHLISGPLGSLYAIYEGIFERLCSLKVGEGWVKPKIIASTATIRGADEQVLTLYGRAKTGLFPRPGLSMGDSFFGRYARTLDGSLQSGRMYLGIHASDYGSVLTTQVRTFSTALFRPWFFAPERRDPWWTLLAFYNSIRELGGAKTLFDSDIRSRLKFLFNREGSPPDDRRTLKVVEELTSRLTQGDIVKMMDRLSTEYSPRASGLDGCLASNIIEVGVDIDRLSLMGVVGQPKTTSTYIQVTGRVGRRWNERPGLIVTIYNPSKSRDRSHYEQFHSYHRRLYERVEPTTATPFAISAIQRALAGALLVWARQQSNAPVQNPASYVAAIEEAGKILADRCHLVQFPADEMRSQAELRRQTDQLLLKWGLNPQQWESFPPSIDGEYLMLWPGQFATPLQRQRGVAVPSSMRQVDGSAELTITQGYVATQLAQALAAAAPDGTPAAPATPGGI